ncbi:MAG: hypothetical protein II428_05015 [Muribaculaceae bacterium]|jgi:hypothetical protein|nr:hypothetical protein [Muribaculaceae bacterium]MBQ2236066.1 hypothetical protein [Muribaculaceae bacterium]MBQ4005539.1 hypothetical protein [Muribaculaceae bacterium]
MVNGNSTITRSLRWFFGIFMVCVYLGMGTALALNIFDWDNTLLWKTIRWTMATIFVLYGIYRAYRQVKGIDYYQGREDEYAYYDENEEDNNEQPQK